MRTWIALLALSLAAGCNKKDDKTSGSGGKPDPVSKDPNGVRPPAKEDLAEYVKDIPGTGPLKATFETSMGTIHCDLLEDNAPLTVTNFVGLATGKKPWKDPKTREVVRNRPLYDNTIFHRVIPGFMIQGGDPMGVGRGGPGYAFPNEDGGAKFAPGTLAMANSGKDTNGSQFFITEVTTGLPPDGYTIFGKCNEVDLVKQIAAVPKECPECDPNVNPKGSTPRDPVTLKHITISR